MAVETLTGQPDVVLLQAADGLPWASGLAAEEAFIWDLVAAAGYPEADIREAGPGRRAPGVRGLTGAVTRKVEAGESLGVTAPAYEISFPIPAGMSGGPVFAMSGGIRQGLIGVCLANVSATSYLSAEMVETIGGERKLIQETRMVEYGIVANLHRSAESRVRLVDRPFGELLGFET
jgi:hypothetical protein